MSPLVALSLVALAGASFFFALAETALFSLGKYRLQQLNAQSPRRAMLVAALLAEPRELLATIVLGNTFANAGIVATVLWHALGHHWPIAPTLAGLLAVLLLGCEAAPKILSVRSPQLWALRVAGPMHTLLRATLPARLVAEQFDRLALRLLGAKRAPVRGVSDEEYRELIDMACQQGALGQSETEIILEIISLDQKTAKDAMKPRSQLATVSDDLSTAEMVAAARRHKHRRLPIYDETVDTIVGILNTRVLLLNPEADFADAVEFPSFVPESMNLLRLMKSLQRQQRGLAVVLDEFGGTAGIVTLEDILEEVVGEIRSEHEAAEFILEKLGESRWRVSGTMRIEDFGTHYPELGEVDGVETMGGLLVSLAEVVPTAGQSQVFRGLRLTAQVADERRVKELLVEVLGKKPSAAAKAAMPA
jgi:CBS domain containing-hemolysin-like protein